MRSRSAAGKLRRRRGETLSTAAPLAARFCSADDLAVSEFELGFGTVVFPVLPIGPYITRKDCLTCYWHTGRNESFTPSGVTPLWGWGYRSFVLSPGQEVCWSVGNGYLTAFTQWKWGLVWDEADVGHAADIDIYAIDADTNQTIAFQDDYSLSNRITLGKEKLAGRRISACVRAYYIPPSETRRVFTMDFTHNDGED
jgi:hypothetical protein